MDEHKHSPARRRYSKFVYYVQNYYRHRTYVIVCWLPKFNGFNLAPLFSITPRVEVNFVDVCGFDARQGSPELQQVRLPVRFSRRRLRFSPRTHTSVLLYSDTVLCPGDNSIRLGRTDASRQNSATKNARSRSYRYTGVMLGQALCRVQRQLNVKAIVVWNSWSRRYPPQMRENLLPVLIIRRQKATTPEDTCTNHPVCCIVGSALGLE